MTLLMVIIHLVDTTLNFNNEKDLVHYTPTIGKHIYGAAYRSESYVYPLEKFYYQDGDIFCYKCEGEDKRP